MGVRQRIGKWFLKMLEVGGENMYGSWGDWGMLNYNTLSREGYENCATVYRCVNLISKTSGRVLFGAFTDSENGPELIQNHSVITKLQRPNPMFGRYSFIKYWAMCLLLGGRSFIWANVLGDGTVHELWVIPPNDVEIHWNEEFYGVIDYYEWNYNGNINRIPPEQILYMWFPNPRNSLLHMSPLQAASQEVDLSNEGLRWNLSLMLNGAKPSAYISLHKDTEANLSPKQVEELKQQLKEDHSGPKKVGSTPVLRVPGMQLTPYGWNPQDLDWLKGLGTADVRIANVYDVPPELVGAQKTYENMRQAWRIFYESAVMPLLDYLADELTNWPILGIPEDEYLAPRREKIKALQDDQDAISKRVVAEVNTGLITRNEGRADLQKPPSDDPMADVLTVTKEVSPLAIAEFNTGTEDIEPKPEPKEEE